MHLGQLATQIWLAPASPLHAYEVMVDTFIDNFIDGIFVFEQKIVPSHSHSAAVRFSYKNGQESLLKTENKSPRNV